MRPVRVADEPLGALIHPDAQRGRLEELDRRRDELLADDALLDHLHPGLDDETAVERRDRRPKRERLDEHRHAARRPPARHREVDPRVVQLVHRLDRAIGEHLLLRDERAVDVREQQLDHFIAR